MATKSKSVNGNGSSKSVKNRYKVSTVIGHSDWTPEVGSRLPNSKGFPFKQKSHITPNDIWNSIADFSHRIPRRTQIPEYSVALKVLKEEMQLNRKIKPKTFSDACIEILQGAFPELPYISKNTDSELNLKIMIEIHLKYIERYWENMNTNKRILLPDSYAFVWHHVSSTDVNEVKLEWVLPLTAIAQEARFALPLIEELTSKRMFTSSAYGCEIMKDGIMWVDKKALSLKSKDPGAKFLMTYYSAFDSSIPAWLIRDCFYILLEKFDLTTDVDEQIFDTSVESWKFKRLINYFINTSICNCDGRRFVKAHGIPSGSMFANIIRSMVNYLITYTACLYVFKTEPDFLLVFGDNSVIGLRNSAIIDINQYALLMKVNFGITIDTDKSCWTYLPTNIILEY